MTIEVSVETTIERSPDGVFEQVSAVDVWPAWLIASGITAVRRSGSGPLARGERLVVEQHVAGRAGRFAAEVTDYEPPTCLAIRGRDDDGIGIEIEASLTPVERSTSLRWTIRIRLPLRYRMFESIARPQVERAALLDLEALRVRLETGAGH